MDITHNKTNNIICMSFVKVILKRNKKDCISHTAGSKAVEALTDLACLPLLVQQHRCCRSLSANE